MFCYIHYMISRDRGIRSRQIFEELHNKLKEKKLLDKLQEVRIVTCGDLKQLNLDFRKYEKCVSLEHCDDLSKWEFPTLLRLKKDSENMTNETPILYIHLKGVTSNSSDWRKKLADVVIGRHEECLSNLSHYNACGPMMSEPYYKNGKMPRHFSGNFWWTTARHVKNLPTPEIPEIVKDYGFLVEGRKNRNTFQPSNQNYRYLSEFWIGFLDMESEHRLKEIR